MLTITENITPKFIFNIDNEEDTSQKGDIQNKLLDDFVASAINPIFDNEVTEFKPEKSSVDFYIFFSAFKNMDWFKQLENDLEEPFKFHLNDALAILQQDAKQTITNPKTFLQNIGIPIPKPDYFFHKRMKEVLAEVPYVPLDPVQHLTEIAPSKEGIPVFYNSFTLPFGKSFSKWSDDNLGFSNKSYLYNSFLLIDFFTTNNPLTQKKVMSIPVYVNGRYMDHEISSRNVKQLRPVFYLDNGTEAYSFVWLKQYRLDKLYARFSFWDALNGEQIPLLPSSDQSGKKKWVQDPNNFKQENLYLEYNFNYKLKSYNISEFNEKTGIYNVNANSFDLYQLVYDEYFVKLSRIANERPFKESNIATDTFEDVNLTLSQTSLTKEVDTTLDESTEAYKVLAEKYGHQHKTILGKALHSIFAEKDVKLKDRALVFFQKIFNDEETYKQDLGVLNITNSSGFDLIIKGIEIKNIVVENKNNFIDGPAIATNRFRKTAVTETPTAFINDTVFTFKVSKFFKKISPIKVPFDATETAAFNKQADLYSSYYYDESSNKVVSKPPEDINAIIEELVPKKKRTFFGNLLMHGGSLLGFTSDKKKRETKIKGLTLGEKDLTLLLRNDVLEKSGSKAKYELLFPATQEKLTKNTSKYQDFGVTIITNISPLLEEFSKDVTVTLNTDVIFGKEFFKLFISTNDDVIIKYDVQINFIDENAKTYKKVVPCSLKYF